MSDAEKTGTLTVLDKAVQAAKAKAAAKKAGGSPTTAKAGDDGAKPKAEKPAKAPKVEKPKAEPKRVKLTDEEKAARQAAKDAERVVKKAEREAKRAEKKAAKEAEKKPAHMSKVEKAAAKLPTLSGDAQFALDNITANFSAAEVTSIAAHLQHFNRARATERAGAQVNTLKAGDTVRVIGGDARYIGQVGEVFKAQRIRCYVSLPNVNKPIYLFISDVESCSAVAREMISEAMTG